MGKHNRLNSLGFGALWGMVIGFVLLSGLQFCGVPWQHRSEEIPKKEKVMRQMFADLVVLGEDLKKLAIAKMKRHNAYVRCGYRYSRRHRKCWRFKPSAANLKKQTELIKRIRTIRADLHADIRMLRYKRMLDYLYIRYSRIGKILYRNRNRPVRFWRAQYWTAYGQMLEKLRRLSKRYPAIK